METPYEGYPGNNSFATLSLVMGILSILTLCCFPPAIFVFAGLGILFSCLSKGQYTRPGTAKAGMAISVSCIAIAAAFIIAVCTFLFVSEKGQQLIQDYMNLITSPNVTEEDIYHFMEKYLYDNYDYDDGNDTYENPGSYDFYEYDDDDLPDFYQEPDFNNHNDGNFI